MLKPIAIAIALLSAVPATAQDDPSFAAYRDSKKLASAPDLTVHYGPDDLRIGELRLPRGKGPFPVAVMIHGGCWSASFDTYKGFGTISDALTKRGIATWNMEYRRLGDAGAGWPGTWRRASII